MIELRTQPDFSMTTHRFDTERYPRSKCSGKALGNTCYGLQYPSMNEMQQADKSNNLAERGGLTTTKKRNSHPG